MTTRPREARPADQGDQDLTHPGYPKMEPGESPIGSVAAAISAQLDRVILELADPDPGKAVHNARKTIKRIRGLLRLIRDVLGRDAYRVLNQRMRDAARVLAHMRDAAIRLETFDVHVSRLAEDIGSDVLSRTRDCLASEFASAYTYGAIHRDVAPNIGAVVEAARDGLAASGLGIVDRPADDASEEFSQIARGLNRTYRSTRNEMRVATVAGDFNEFHEWRKGVKYLRYQLEHLELINPVPIGVMTAVLKQVDEGLGDAHDLWMLGNFIEAHAACCPDRDEREIFVGETDQMRREFDARALRLGQAFFAERPKDFSARIKGYWEAAEG